jgi:hypothetical protein
MGDERGTMKSSTRWSLLTLFVALAVLSPIAAWRLSSWLIAPEPYRPPPIVHLIETEEAQRLAIAEVKAREGWVGTADLPSQEGVLFFVAVRRKPGETSDWRYITISGVRDSAVVAYYDLRDDHLPGYRRGPADRR